jgi:hypothetical protein
MNSKLKELLKKLGVKATLIEKYTGDDDKVKDLKPEEDGEEILTAIQTVYRNTIEDDIKKDSDKTARAHVYGEIENFFMKEGGFKKEDVIAGGVAEPKWKDFGNFYKKKLSDGKADDNGKSKTAVKELEDALTEANKQIVTLKADVVAAQEKSTKEIDNFKVGVQKESTLIDAITKMDKKTIVEPKKVLKLINDRLSDKYELVHVGGKFEIRDKANPEKRVNKTATEFVELQDALTEAIEAEGLFEKSNGGERKKVDMGGGKDDDGDDKGKDDKGRRKVVLPASALETDEENSKLGAKE